eukprot:10908519-Alexandrium_andersonii.AAC.1
MCIRDSVGTINLAQQESDAGLRGQGGLANWSQPARLEVGQFEEPLHRAVAAGQQLHEAP